MISVGELKEIIDVIEREYGSDANVCISYYDYGSEEHLDPDYARDTSIAKDGTLYLANYKLSE